MRRAQAGLRGHVDEAIDSVAELERRALSETTEQQRLIERVTRAVGRPQTVALVLIAAGLWIALNAGMLAAGLRPLDAPPFFWLDTALTLAGVVTALLVLTTENRQSEMEEQRSRLHLQISLLAERKTAKAIQLLEELRYDLPSVPNRIDSEAQELTLPSDPHEVAQELERRTPARGEVPGR